MEVVIVHIIALLQLVLAYHAIYQENRGEVLIRGRRSPEWKPLQLTGAMLSSLPLRHCRSLARIRPHVCLSRLHDSGIRHSLFAPVGGDRTGCRQAGPYHEGFCGGRSEFAAADRDCHGLCHLVRRRGRARDLGHVCQGRVTRRRRRSLWVKPLPDPGRVILCPSFLSAESLDRRRLLSCCGTTASWRCFVPCALSRPISDGWLRSSKCSD